ncbi:MAG: rhomboid family intramembrane serine protease [Thermoguttaceae bacterium]
MFFLPIELKQTVPKGPIPVANALLIAANVLMYLLAPRWTVGYGPVSPGFHSGPLAILLYGFSHINMWHLVLNLWALWLFGNPVNRRLGNGYYLAAYLGAVLAVGLICRFCCPDQGLGASGAIFAVIAIAMILLPSAGLEMAYVVIFPIAVLVGLAAPPKKYWLHWLLRWGTFELRMVWCLLLAPLILLADLLLAGMFFGIWSWSTGAHLLGMVCGVAIVLLLPARITMPGRAAQTAF